MVLGPGHADQQRESTGGSFVSHCAHSRRVLGRAKYEFEGHWMYYPRVETCACANVVPVRKVGAVKQAQKPIGASRVSLSVKVLWILKPAK